MRRHRKSSPVILILFVTLVGELQGHAQVITYEGGFEFPEQTNDGWAWTPQCDPERWLAGGWLHQHVDPGCGGPPGGDSDRYIRSMNDFAGEARLFFHWRIRTDGNQSEIPGAVPATMVAADDVLVSYHFSMARDRVRIIRDNLLPIVFVDLDPAYAHTYYLELFGVQFYRIWIDDLVVDEGRPEGSFDAASAVVAWRSKPWFLSNSTSWDFVRLGRIPQTASGDYDSDGDIDLRDWYYFRECTCGCVEAESLDLNHPDAPTHCDCAGDDAGPSCRWADMDADGDIDFHDFAVFQRAFTGEYP